MPIVGEVPAPEATLTPTEGTMIDAQILGEILGLDTATAQRLFTVASAMVAEYTTAAPDPIRDEAIIRLSAYMKQMPQGGLRKLDVGNTSLEFQTTVRSPLRASTAEALLSPYVTRRAMGIG